MANFIEIKHEGIYLIISTANIKSIRPSEHNEAHCTIALLSPLTILDREVLNIDIKMTMGKAIDLLEAVSL